MGEGTQAPEVRADGPPLEKDDTSRYRFLSQPPQTRGHLPREEERSTRRAILPPSARADLPLPRTGVSLLSPCQGGESWGTTRCQSGKAPGMKTGRFFGDSPAHAESLGQNSS